MADSVFTRIDDKDTVLKYLTSIKESSGSALIWKIIGDSKFTAEVKIEAIRKTRGDFILVPDEGDADKVQSLMGTNGFIDFYIPESSLIFRCKIRQTEAPVRYFLEVPEFMAQIERRQSLRLDLSDSNEVTIKFSKHQEPSKTIQQKFSKNCFDISAGGLSFLVSRLESKSFKVNDFIRAVEIQTPQWKSQVILQVALVKELTPDENSDISYKAWKVSCRFISLDDISKKYLTKFVFERLKSNEHVINT